MTLSHATVLFAQDDAGGFISAILGLAIIVFIIAGVWKTFQKAGQPGWAAIIPIYNAIVLLEIAKRPLWWILLLLIPVVNIIVGILVALDIARNFGKSGLFGLGLAFFPFICYPILGFSDARYRPA